jgi:hypothetical protein
MGPSDNTVKGKDSLQEQLANDGADRGHNLDQGVVDLGNLVSMLREIAKPQHIRHEIDREDL